MDLILCHQTADFDALGAAVGLAGLKPGSRIVLTGGAHPAVRDFLALYRNELPLLELRSVNPRQIRALYIVDTQHRERLGKAKDWLTLPQLEKIVLYDHHQEGIGDIPATELHLEAVGAATTLVVEALQAENATLTLIQATLMALGIHVDTGSLTFEQTTARDAAALAWLLTQGASLRLVAQYVEPSFSPQLESLFTQALTALERRCVGGYEVGQVLLETEEFMPGLSHLTERLLELTDCDAVLLAHHYPRRGLGKGLTLIGRTRIPQTNLVPLLAPLGGGGHAQAASAQTQADNPKELLSQLTQALAAQIPAPAVARDLMSSPVRTILPQTTIEQAQRLLLRYGHSGLTVVDEEGRLTGIISRRDLDLALHHGLAHAPVKGYMTRNLKTITPDTPLPAIEALMVTADVGRLPVLAGEKLLGIVTRTDVLRQLLQERGEKEQPTPREIRDLGQKSFWETVELPPGLKQLLRQTARLAERRGWNLYLVGGAVRDLLLARERPEIVLEDLDLVVDSGRAQVTVGAGGELARELQQSYPQAKLSIHGEFQTAALFWPEESALGPLWLDIATARTEFYPYPAANPEVEVSNLRQDLYRRDFAINALALCLTGAGEKGKLLDFFGGLADLEARLIRVLHANSFIEDPTRIYRAVRFAVRLGFRLESQTEAYIRYALESGVYERLRLTGHPAPALTTRLKGEFSIILKAPYWPQALDLLSRLGALQCLHPDLTLTPELKTQLRTLSRWLKYLDPERRWEHWALRLTLLLSSLPSGDAATIAANLQLPQTLVEILAAFNDHQNEIQLRLPDCRRPSEIAVLLDPYPGLSLILIASRSPHPLRRVLWLYLTRLAKMRPVLSGEDLKRLGYKPGPVFKTILDRLRRETLDGNLKNGTMAQAWLAREFPL
ncbi:MAG: CBS domain-containing protein [Cyanobacteriota bacterium]